MGSATPEAVALHREPASRAFVAALGLAAPERRLATVDRVGPHRTARRGPRPASAVRARPARPDRLRDLHRQGGGSPGRQREGQQRVGPHHRQHQGRQVVRDDGSEAAPRRRHQAAEAGHEGGVRRPELQRVGHGADLGPAPRSVRGVLVVDGTSGTGSDGRDHVDRQVEGEGLRHREAEDDLRRRRRLRRRETGDPGGRRVPEVSRQVPGDRSAHPQGGAARGPARQRQDTHRARRRRRGGSAVHVGHGLRLHGDVRRRRRVACPRHVPDRPQAGSRDHLHRRDRLDRAQARGRSRRWPRRARADPESAALRDGRVRDHRGHRDDGRHQQARHPRPRPPPPGALRPADRRAPPRPRGAATHPQGALP